MRRVLQPQRTPRLFRVKERMFLFDRAETAITRKPMGNGTEATCEYQFEMIIRLKFTQGLVAKMGRNRIKGNLDTAKKLLEVT